MGRLKNKVALVTASAQGIGKEITKSFLNEGAIVYGTDIQLKNLNDLSHPNLKKIKFDVTDKKDLDNIVFPESLAFESLILCSKDSEAAIIFENLWVLHDLAISKVGMTTSIGAGSCAM